MSFSIEKLIEKIQKIQKLKKIDDIESLIPSHELPQESHTIESALVVDVEATGLCGIMDEVIELSYLKFNYYKLEDGSVGFLNLEKVYEGLQKPDEIHKSKFAPDKSTMESISNDELKDKYPISEITGITWDELEKAKGIDWDGFTNDLRLASFATAYNSDYDEKMCSKYINVPETPWYCAMRNVDWRKHKFINLKQEMMVAEDLKIRFNAHRAKNDNLTLLLLLIKDNRLNELLSPQIEVQARGFVSKKFCSLYFTANRFYFQNRREKQTNKGQVSYKDDKMWVRKISLKDFESLEKEAMTAANFENKKHSLKLTYRVLPHKNKFMKD